MYTIPQYMYDERTAGYESMYDSVEVGYCSICGSEIYEGDAYESDSIGKLVCMDCIADMENESEGWL